MINTCDKYEHHLPKNETGIHVTSYKTYEGSLAELYCVWLVRPSVCLSVLTNGPLLGTLKYLNFSCSNSNSGFIRPTITMKADKNGRLLSVCLLPNFIYGLLPSNSGSNSNMGLVRRTITKMANKMATAYQFRC